MLYVETDHVLEQTPLIAGRLSPIRRELPLPPLLPANQPDVELETAAVLAALASGRDSDERAVDYVVDRLLEELTW